jgi:hypothetical protein
MSEGPVEHGQGIHLGPASIAAINKADADSHLRNKEPPVTHSPPPRPPIVVLLRQGDPLRSRNRSDPYWTQLNPRAKSDTLYVIEFMVRPERFELPTLWFEAKCSIQLSYGRTPRTTSSANPILPSRFHCLTARGAMGRISVWPCV